MRRIPGYKGVPLRCCLSLGLAFFFAHHLSIQSFAARLLKCSGLFKQRSFGFSPSPTAVFWKQRPLSSLQKIALFPISRIPSISETTATRLVGWQNNGCCCLSSCHSLFLFFWGQILGTKAGKTHGRELSPPPPFYPCLGWVDPRRPPLTPARVVPAP